MQGGLNIKRREMVVQQGGLVENILTKKDKHGDIWGE